MKSTNSPFRSTLNAGNYNQAEADFNYDSLNDHIEFSNHMARKKSERMKKWSNYDGKSEETKIRQTWKSAPTDK
jgi:hypothetical protein